jgi:DNA-binding response OmpR family regulator
MTSSLPELGLEQFKNENPDLVLLDHWLPGINGEEVLRRIKEKDPESPSLS